MDMLYLALGEGRRSPMLAAPTGAGKTRIAAEIAIRARSKGKRVLITVPAIELVDQTVQALEAEGLDHVGVMQGLHDRTDSTAPVQVASVQTLARRKMPACDVILVDEAHRFFDLFKRMIPEAKTKGVPVIGLSATPWAKGLGKYYDALLQVTTTQALIDAGYLSPFRVYAPSHPELSQVGVTAGDYKLDELAEAMNTVELVADVVTTWQKLGQQRPTLCFAVDRAHAKELQLQFEAAGVPTGYVDCNTPSEERRQIRDRFRSGEIKVCCNVDCLTTGVDWDVRCLIVARPTRSAIRYVQMIGRGLRTAPGKDHCLILDHSDTTLKLGFVTDIAFDALDDGNQKKRLGRPTAKPRECKSCGYLRPAKVHKCPACGFVPAPQVDIQVGDGDLVELKSGKRAKWSSDQKAVVFGQLKFIGMQRGYSKGWAAHKYRDYFGSWPNHVAHAPPTTPTGEILNWIRSRDIAFFKGSGGGRAA